MTNKEFIDKIDNTHWCYVFCLAFLPYMFLALFLVRDVALGYVRSFNAPAADKLLHYSWAANGFPLNIPQYTTIFTETDITSWYYK